LIGFAKEASLEGGGSCWLVGGERKGKRERANQYKSSPHHTEGEGRGGISLYKKKVNQQRRRIRLQRFTLEEDEKKGFNFQKGRGGGGESVSTSHNSPVKKGQSHSLLSKGKKGGGGEGYWGSTGKGDEKEKPA